MYVLVIDRDPVLRVKKVKSSNHIHIGTDLDGFPSYSGTDLNELILTAQYYQEVRHGTIVEIEAEVENT